MAQYFLWTYPKKRFIIANAFQVCDKYASGKNIWSMIEAISRLKSSKIFWNVDFDKDHTEIFIVSVDGTDFRIWEPKHPNLPFDKDFYSHKHKRSALRYEIAIALKESQIVWISGPHRGGKSDLQIFNEEHGLGEKICHGKKAIADGTYKGSLKLAPPDCLESKGLQNFKSRARLRQETLNGRLKKFAALEQTFRHGLQKHKLAFEAICVIVQNTMNCGSGLYDV